MGEWTYEKEDFFTTKPYEALYAYHKEPFTHAAKMEELAAYALKEKGFKGFKSMYKKYVEGLKTQSGTIYIDNVTNFTNQPLELNAGDWEADDSGIFRKNGYNEEVACPHPIMPVERLVNIDTGEEKLKLAFRKGAIWRQIVVSKTVLANSNKVTELAGSGIAVTSQSARAFIQYISDLENLNYDTIPETKSIGRLGYIEGEGFSPYVENLVFDGDTSYRNMYGYIREHGLETKWFDTALECRKMSVTARIFLAASFASPILSVVGSLPFFVHCWGGSGTGKTVALMLAASVWGDPLKGRFVQTFNATRVGQELTAAFLNQLPMCIDELQLTKNGKGQSSFDVYQLAEGVGKTRGKKSGGVELTPTWDCCFLTTGEDPIISSGAGGGAVNRVIEIECSEEQKVIEDAPRIANLLKQHYGWAGRRFVEQLYKDDSTLERVREIYQMFVNELNENDTTEKQALAAAAILTADMCATAWIFQDNNALTVEEVKTFLASKAAVSTGARAYSWICNWVAENENHFYTDNEAPVSGVYGKLEYGMAYINNNVLTQALNENGFNATATYSYLKANGLIESGSGRGYGRSKKVGKTNTYCICLRLPSDDEVANFDDELPL